MTSLFHIQLMQITVVKCIFYNKITHDYNDLVLYYGMILGN